MSRRPSHCQAGVAESSNSNAGDHASEPQVILEIERRGDLRDLTEGEGLDREIELGTIAALEIRYRNTDQPDTLLGRQHTPNETDTYLVKDRPRRDRCRQASASSRLLEIGIFNFDGDSAPKGIRFQTPRPDFIRLGDDFPLDGGRLGQIFGEGRFRSRRFALSIRSHWPIVLAAGDRVIPRPRFAKMRREKFQRLAP